MWYFNKNIYDVKNSHNCLNLLTTCTFTSSTGPDGEPRITHGNTLVSDLSLEEVAKIIDVSL